MRNADLFNNDTPEAMSYEYERPILNLLNEF